jgi:hypothetical protein
MSDIIDNPSAETTNDAESSGEDGLLDFDFLLEENVSVVQKDSINETKSIGTQMNKIKNTTVSVDDHIESNVEGKTYQRLYHTYIVF